MFRSISEFQSINWELNTRNGLAVLLVLWPVLQLRGARAGEFDVTEFLLWVVLTPAALTNQRFIGPWAISATLFVARDLDAWSQARRWPQWTVAPARRAVFAAVACVAMTSIELTQKAFVPGIGLIDASYPAAACRFIERHGISGRSFNQLEFGGYLLWRFWPDRGRLPFTPIHPEAMKPEDRAGYVRALIDPRGWAELDRRYRFDWVLVKTGHSPDEHLIDFLDADTTFRLVFTDDAAALYLRRHGGLASLAESLAFRIVPGGEARLDQAWDLVRRDPRARAQLEVELRRIVADSPLHAWASSVLVELLVAEGRTQEAEVIRGSSQGSRRTTP